MWSGGGCDACVPNVWLAFVCLTQHIVGVEVVVLHGGTFFVKLVIFIFLSTLFGVVHSRESNVPRTIDLHSKLCVMTC